VVKTLGDDDVRASFDSALGGLRALAAIQDSVWRLDAANGAIGVAGGGDIELKGCPRRRGNSGDPAEAESVLSKARRLTVR
jgi:hypothetical protein